MKTSTPEQAEKKGFATFNGCPHLTVDVPDGFFTITARTSQGKKVTFAFVPYEKDGAAQCVDIEHHTSGRTIERTDGGETLRAQRLIGFAHGHPDTFRTNYDDPTPTVLATLLLCDD